MSDQQPDLEPMDIRASDADRERHAQLLAEHAGHGRLTPEELSERLDRAYAARTRGELAALMRDLPPIRPPAPPAPGPRRDRRRREFAAHLRAFVLVNMLLIGIWAATGADYFWPIWPLLGWGVGILSHASEAYAGRSLLGGSCGRSRARRRTA